MVTIKPFKGIIYNQEKVMNLDEVMSPPYDIISDKMQEDLYQKHPQNFVRLTLGKEFESDTDGNNRYSRAQKDYSQWLEENILIPSDKPALFPYQITYELDGITKEMNGFFTLLQLDKDYNLVKAHERTLSKPKADRLNLMRATHSNLEPIQLLYIDKDDSIHALMKDALAIPPLITVKGYDQFQHSIWKITDESIISQIQESLENEILFIADGHHRYQTAINYAEEQQDQTKNESDDAPFNYRMVILVNIFDTGLEILPTHRLIHLPSNKTKEEVIDSMKSYFTIEKHPIRDKEDTSSLVQTIKKEINNSEKHRFAWCFPDHYYIFTLTDEHIMDTLAGDRSDTWRNLDVSILHKILIEHGLGITQETLEEHVKYTRDDNEAIDLIKKGEFDSSIIMNATKIDELKAIADGGEHMPQKSTYFLPKMLSGLVMYHMDQH